MARRGGIHSRLLQRQQEELQGNSLALIGTGHLTLTKQLHNQIPWSHYACFTGAEAGAQGSVCSISVLAYFYITLRTLREVRAGAPAETAEEHLLLTLGLIYRASLAWVPFPTHALDPPTSKQVTQDQPEEDN